MGLLKGLGSFDDLPPTPPKVVQVELPKSLKKLKRENSGRSAEEGIRERKEIEERAAKLTVLIEYVIFSSFTLTRLIILVDKRDS